VSRAEEHAGVVTITSICHGLKHVQAGTALCRTWAWSHVPDGANELPYSPA
jgi:hypothetical protein